MVSLPDLAGRTLNTKSTPLGPSSPGPPLLTLATTTPKVGLLLAIQFQVQIANVGSFLRWLVYFIRCITLSFFLGYRKYGAVYQQFDHLCAGAEVVRYRKITS